MNWQDLDYFSPSEFVTLDGTDWADEYSAKLLYKLDTFRCYTGMPFQTSKHPRAMGRNDGDSTSAHNIDRWGYVLAIDGFPEGMTRPSIARRYVELATHLGFTGIGVYPQWEQGPGMHLDVRPDHDPRKPAIWGMVNGANGGQIQVSLEHALQVWRAGI
jgi:hypothetical protein